MLMQAGFLAWVSVAALLLSPAPPANRRVVEPGGRALRLPRTRLGRRARAPGARRGAPRPRRSRTCSPFATPSRRQGRYSLTPLSTVPMPRSTTPSAAARRRLRPAPLRARGGGPRVSAPLASPNGATRAAFPAPTRRALSRPHPHEQLSLCGPRAPLQRRPARRGDRAVARAPRVERRDRAGRRGRRPGFTSEREAERLADGHIGLAAQRVRVESAGGTLNVLSEPGLGTRVAIRLPA